MKNYYSRYVENGQPPKIAAWDTETDGLNGKLLLASYAHAGGAGHIAGDPDQIANQLIDIMAANTDKIWFAHNSDYDWRYIIPHLLQRFSDVEFFMRSETNIYQIKVWLYQRTNNKKLNKKIPCLILRDSMALFAGTLKDFARSYAPDNAKIEFDHSVVFDPSNLDHIKYAVQDARSLRASLIGFYASWHKLFGVWPSGTLAGSSIKSWQATLSEQQSFNSLPDEIEDFCRQAYYGGFVFLTDTNKHKNCTTYDRNSSYPASMTEYGVPFGTPIKTSIFDYELEGFYLCDVFCPDNVELPFIPLRTKNGIKWPYGKFTTTITSAEYREAILRGYDIDIISGHVFPEIIFPFDDFIELCKETRLNNPDTPLSTNSKLAQNSLYGRFGARQERVRVIVTDEPPLGAVALEIDRLWVIKEEADILAMPHWAAWITANARLELVKAAYATGIKNVLYGDTDSLTVIGEHCAVPVGKDYGQWKIEARWSEFRALGPKMKIGKLATGQLKTTAKGLPAKKITPQISNSLLKDKSVIIEYDRSPNLLSILKGKSKAGNGTSRATRTSSKLDRSLNWNRDACGKVRAKQA
jgi:hypothetical protein